MVHPSVKWSSIHPHTYNSRQLNSTCMNIDRQYQSLRQWLDTWMKILCCRSRRVIYKTRFMNWAEILPLPTSSILSVRGWFEACIRSQLNRGNQILWQLRVLQIQRDIDNVHARFLSILSDESCSVCMERFTNPVLTPCHHVFCLHCIVPWFNQQHTCTQCRSSLLTTTRGYNHRPFIENSTKSYQIRYPYPIDVSN